MSALTTNEIDAIEAVALAAKEARPGQWDAFVGGGIVFDHHEDACVADCSYSTGSVAEYIVAAQPDAILRLVAALRESRAVLADLVESHERPEFDRDDLNRIVRDAERAL